MRLLFRFVLSYGIVDTWRLVAAVITLSVLNLCYIWLTIEGLRPKALCSIIQCSAVLRDSVDVSLYKLRLST